MATRNDVTGDKIATKAASDAYRDNYDAIFGKKEKADASEQGKDGSPEKAVRK